MVNATLLIVVTESVSQSVMRNVLGAHKIVVNVLEVRNTVSVTL